MAFEALIGPEGEDDDEEEDDDGIQASELLLISPESSLAPNCVVDIVVDVIVDVVVDIVVEVSKSTAPTNNRDADERKKGD